MGIHHVAVFFGEDIAEILPVSAEERCVAILICLVLQQGLAQAVGDRDGADAALGLGGLFQSFSVLRLVDAFA